MDLRPELAAVRAPTLAIAAAEDPATPPEHLARIAHGIAGARLAVIDGASHLAIVEKADEITALVAEHLVAPEVEP
jgi:3-oxoadipate enol-lactonase